MIDIREIIYYKALNYIKNRNLAKILKNKYSSLCDLEQLLVCDSIKYYLPNVDCLVDVGAHKGFFASSFSNLINVNKIICVEPNRNLTFDIKKNNPISNLVIETIGLSDKDGESTYFVHEDSTMNSIVEVDKIVLKEKFPFDNPSKLRETKITVTTLNSLFKRNNIRYTDSVFLKIDTQGNELNILKGGLDVLPQIRGCLVEHMFVKAYRTDYSFIDLMNFMMENNFVFVGVPAILKRPTSELSSADFLFIKRTD